MTPEKINLSAPEILLPRHDMDRRIETTRTNPLYAIDAHLLICASFPQQDRFGNEIANEIVMRQGRGISDEKRPWLFDKNIYINGGGDLKAGYVVRVNGSNGDSSRYYNVFNMLSRALNKVEVLNRAEDLGNNRITSVAILPQSFCFNHLLPGQMPEVLKETSRVILGTADNHLKRNPNSSIANIVLPYSDVPFKINDLLKQGK